VEIPAKSETSNYGLRFFTFFGMPLLKNVKSRVFLDFQKNVKNVFSNYARNPWIQNATKAEKIYKTGKM